MNCLRLFKLCERQSINVFKTYPVRFVTNHPIKFLQSQDRWRERDGVSKRWQLIYRTPMDNVLKFMATYLTVSTTTIAVSSLYYAAMVFDPASINDPVIIGDDVVIANSALECLIYLGAFIALNISVRVLLSRFVIRLYQDGDEYLAIFRGNFHNTINKHKFHLKEFRKLDPTLVVTWSDARYGLGPKHGILLENYFKTPEHFNYLKYKRSVDKPDNDDD